MSKTKKFSCSILDYLKRKDEKLYEIINEDLCLGGNLKPFKGVGVTFVIPDGKTAGELAKLAKSEDEDDIRKAVEMVKAHILVGLYDAKNPMHADVANKLYKKIGVKSAGATVVLKNGTTLTLDGGFRNMPDREMMSVYIASGPMPTDGEAADRTASNSRGAKKRETVGEGEGDGWTQQQRDACADKLNAVAGQKEKVGQYCLSVVLKLLNYIENKPSYGRALASLDMSPYTSFFLLIQPYCDCKKVVSDEDLAGFDCSAGEVTANSVKEYLDFIKKGHELMADKVGNTVDDARWDITSYGLSKKVIMSKISDKYNELVKNMYKDQSIGEFMSADQFKLKQDEARFHINYMITYWEQDILAHKHEWNAVMDTIRATLKSEKPVLSAKMDGEVLPSTVSFFTGPIAFIESRSFLYFPCVKANNVDTEGAGEEEGMYGGHQEIVAECSGAGSGKLETLESCAGICD